MAEVGSNTPTYIFSSTTAKDTGFEPTNLTAILLEFPKVPLSGTK